MFSMVGRFILIGLIVGLILGLILGLVIGWGILPVHWTYADQWVEDYVILVSTAYGENNDLALAQWRLEQTLEWPKKEQGQRLNEVLTRYQQRPGASTQAIGEMRGLLNALGAPLPAVSPTVPVAVTPTAGLPLTPVAAPTPAAGPGPVNLGGLAGSLLPLCCVAILIVIIVAVAALVWTNRGKLFKGRAPAWRPVEEDWAAPLAAEEGVDVTGPHMRFTARYSLGQDNYEESFSVESPAGGFFGECGVSAAERLGKEGPDKVTAFDLWLFDVASRETVTKVLLSDWGYKDDPLRTQLISRGGVILAEKGKVITLETQNLRVDIKVVDLDYGSMEDLPANSFFSSLTLDMIARIKET